MQKGAWVSTCWPQHSKGKDEFAFDVCFCFL